MVKIHVYEVTLPIDYNIKYIPLIEPLPPQRWMYCITSTRREVMQYISAAEGVVWFTKLIESMPYLCLLVVFVFVHSTKHYIVENEATILILQYHNRHAQQSVHKSGWGSLSQLTLELVEGIRGASSLASPVLPGGKLTRSSCTRIPVEA